MALKRPQWKPGTVVLLEHDSTILRDNALRDPHVRKLAVWLPPQYEGSGNRRFPVLYDLVGFTGSGLSHVAWKNFSENVPERVARLIHERRMAPTIMVFPDCFTALGGNQYVNSSAIGNYADYLVRELVEGVRPVRAVHPVEIRVARMARDRAPVLGVQHAVHDRAVAAGRLAEAAAMVS